MSICVCLWVVVVCISTGGATRRMGRFGWVEIAAAAITPAHLDPGPDACHSAPHTLPGHVTAAETES